MAKTKPYTVSGTVITFTHAGHPDVTVDMAKVHENVRAAAAIFGMAQVRLLDAGAVPRADSKGNLIPEADRVRMAYERRRRIAEHYMSGSPGWELPRVAGPRVAAEEPIELVHEAIARAIGKAVSDVPAKLAELVTRMRLPTGEPAYADAVAAARGLEKTQSVQKALLAIKAERIVPTQDGDAMLAELMGEDGAGD